MTAASIKMKLATRIQDQLASSFDALCLVRLTTSKVPGATIRLSMTLLILVTSDKMDD